MILALDHKAIKSLALQMCLQVNINIDNIIYMPRTKLFTLVLLPLICTTILGGILQSEI